MYEINGIIRVQTNCRPGFISVGGYTLETPQGKEIFFDWFRSSGNYDEKTGITEFELEEFDEDFWEESNGSLSDYVDKLSIFKEGIVTEASREIFLEDDDTHENLYDSKVVYFAVVVTHETGEEETIELRLSNEIKNEIMRDLTWTN